MITKYLNRHPRIFVAVIRALTLANFARRRECDARGVRCEFDWKNVNYKYTLLGRDTPTCCLTHLYEVLKEVAHVFTEADVEYFIMYGTLLGHTRHGRTFIPWDTDIDLIVLSHTRQEVADLLSEMLPKSFSLKSKPGKILRVNYSKKNRLHADIYFWDEQNGEFVDSFNDHWVRGRVKKRDVLPLVSSTLYDLNIKVPHNSVAVLNDTYGDDCLGNAYKKYAHTREILTSFVPSTINCKSFARIDIELGPDGDSDLS